MRFPSQFRLRFSLRWMLIAMTIFALTFGYYASAIRKNVVATKQLRARNVFLIDRLIDPIGPNFVYDLLYGDPCIFWSAARCNNEIIDDFQGWFGVVGYTHAMANGIDITAGDARHFAQMPFLHHLTLTDCKLPLEAVKQIVEIGGLQVIILEGTSITPAGLAMLRERRPECEVEICPYPRLSASR
jgi:hypothetical protein